MTKVIVIHGISVRESKDVKTFECIKQRLSEEIPDINVIYCAWGDSLGGKLNAGGASIPLYDSTKKSVEVPSLDENTLRWIRLFQDPLYELRLLSLDSPEDDFFSNSSLKDKVAAFNPSEQLTQQFNQCGIEDIFQQAMNNVINSNPYKNLVNIENQEIIARAVIAEAIVISDRNNKEIPLINDLKLREELVESLSNEIDSTSERGGTENIISKIFKILIPLGKSMLTRYLRGERGLISDGITPFVGDVLLYQGRGKKIRGLIKSYIEEADEPVVLLAHSLGGIACVDLLIEESLSEQVKLLITVGSQAPYFYELNALQSLEFGKSLPEHFPSWLNIYDLRDFLSYIGGTIFPDKVQDVLVDNQKSFPDSHNEYWNNTATWKAIVGRIKTL
ncbi:hypothetical protein [Crocosphaera chwakensis]|uniref:Uncharacterized protein n=1 Tax=Crocosphaera chwakensis CCY0110 TaxID=391612 RepID=A3ITY9_9CHRO|nr:hypothetical protein [Crocosphaera chwakensis]EAZ90084.1 hypothetical protein CY0110_15100 [Crocosphaera chwakensis CCY0110]